MDLNNMEKELELLKLAVLQLSKDTGIELLCEEIHEPEPEPEPVKTKKNNKKRQRAKKPKPQTINDLNSLLDSLCISCECCN